MLTSLIQTHKNHFLRLREIWALHLQQVERSVTILELWVTAQSPRDLCPSQQRCFDLNPHLPLLWRTGNHAFVFGCRWVAWEEESQLWHWYLITAVQIPPHWWEWAGAGGRIAELPAPLDVSVSPETSSTQSSGSRAGLLLHPWKHHHHPSMAGLKDVWGAARALELLLAFGKLGMGQFGAAGNWEREEGKNSPMYSHRKGWRRVLSQL